jgi:hypothetical protein
MVKPQVFVANISPKIWSGTGPKRRKTPSFHASSGLAPEICVQISKSSKEKPVENLKNEAGTGVPIHNICNQKQFWAGSRPFFFFFFFFLRSIQTFLTWFFFRVFGFLCFWDIFTMVKISPILVNFSPIQNFSW